MKLTGRQKVFLSKFLDLYGEAEGPLHYTTVAERLGVSKITAYDMLRILEEKGLVASEYVLPVKGHGPGRVGSRQRAHLAGPARRQGH